MGDPWTGLLTAGVAPLIVAYLAYRGLRLKELSEARNSAASRVDAATAKIVDAQMADNARLRGENADMTQNMARLWNLLILWNELAREMRHGRNNDRHLANAHASLHGIASVEWTPIPSLPGLEEIAR